MAKQLAAVLLVSALLGAGIAPCAGWEGTAKARHDCCVDAQCPAQIELNTHSSEHSGPVSQAEADQCCAASEKQHQSRSAQSSVAAFVLATPVDVVVVALTDIRPPGQLAAEIVALVPSPPAPLHLLYSVFLV